MSAWRHPPFLLLLLAAVLLGATFTAPRLTLKRPSYRYLRVFDISQSMNVADVRLGATALTRLEFAKQRALEALKDLPCGSAVGLALFSGHRAFLMITPIEPRPKGRGIRRFASQLPAVAVAEERRKQRGIYLQRLIRRQAD